MGTFDLMPQFMGTVNLLHGYCISSGILKIVYTR